MSGQRSPGLPRAAPVTAATRRYAPNSGVTCSSALNILRTVAGFGVATTGLATTGGRAMVATFPCTQPHRTACVRAARTMLCAFRMDEGARPFSLRVTYQRSRSWTRSRSTGTAPK